MRRGFFLGLVFLSLFLSGVRFGAAWTSAEEQAFEVANEAYRGKNYQEAVSKYSALVEKYPDTATLLYNLGNSYYRLGAIGQAILAYERALLLEPRNGDIRYNLQYLRRLLEYRVEDKRNWYIRAGDEVLRYFREIEVSLIALLAYFAFLSACTFAVFFRPGLPWGWRRKTLLIAAACVFIFWGAKNVQTDVIRDAIVLQSDVEARYGPSNTDQVAFRLGEGLKVHVVKKRENWSRIILTNGESGWVKNNQIEEVKQR